MGYVIIDGGSVQQLSANTEVFDLDCTHDQFPDVNTWVEVEEVRDRLTDYAAMDGDDFDWALAQADRWLVEHYPSLCPDAAAYVVVDGRVQVKDA